MAINHLWPKEIFEQDGFSITSFILEDAHGDRTSVWYRLPSQFSPAITRSCDPFVLASLFKAMMTPADLKVHGEVSPSLLCNLEEFQAAWTCWRPERYSRIEIIPDIEQEQSESCTSNAVMLFSGGVDSCFTAWRYQKETGERLTYKLQAGIFIHGIEIPIKFETSFNIASTKNKSILGSLGIDFIPMVTNQRIINKLMADNQAAFMASCLMLLQKGFDAGIIAGSHHYKKLKFPYGTNPVTDPMLSNKTFSILYDGARFSRLEKIAVLPHTNR